MDDLISRSALIDYIKVWEIGCAVGHDQKTFLRAIQKQPPVEAVPVVRCKDCINYNLGRIACRSPHLNGITPMNGYCHNGKTREMALKEYAEKEKKVQE